MDIDPKLLADFSGTARLLPLPNLVLFPYVVQPLHMFELRYRQMMADALAGDRLLALALLKPGWENDYYKRPPVFPDICLARILQEEKLPDGHYNLLLHGISRARIVKELKTDRLYRSARVELLEDVPVQSDETDRNLRRRLGKQMKRWLASRTTALDQLSKMLESGTRLGTLCDIFSFAVPLRCDLKQELLEETNVEHRIEKLLAHLNVRTPPGPADPAPVKQFPPEFSTN